jgi:methyltransferase
MEVMVMFFLCLLILIGLQRVSELIIAKRNEKWMKKQGAYEVGMDHYKYIVAVHLFFFLSLIVEFYFFEKNLSPIYPVLLFLFLLTQAVRIWAISSLGKFWNTKILILPYKESVTKGPYAYLKHPNYVVVALEILLIPLMFNAYVTALVFTILNIMVLSIRIPIEEKALLVASNYEMAFAEQKRFLPRIAKKLRKY